jgi:hypothetical protein
MLTKLGQPTQPCALFSACNQCRHQGKLLFTIFIDSFVDSFAHSHYYSEAAFRPFQLKKGQSITMDEAALDGDMAEDLEGDDTRGSQDEEEAGTSLEPNEDYVQESELVLNDVEVTTAQELGPLTSEECKSGCFLLKKVRLLSCNCARAQILTFTSCR